MSQGVYLIRVLIEAHISVTQQSSDVLGKKSLVDYALLDQRPFPIRRLMMRRRRNKMRKRKSGEKEKEKEKGREGEYRG